VRREAAKRVTIHCWLGGGTQAHPSNAVNAVCHAALGACVNPEAEPDVDLPIRTKVSVPHAFM
jgi:hypothetical protein